MYALRETLNTAKCNERYLNQIFSHQKPVVIVKVSLLRKHYIKLQRKKFIQKKKLSFCWVVEEYTVEIFRIEKENAKANIFLKS